MKPNPIVQAFFPRAWVIVGGLKSDDFQLLRSSDTNLAAMMRANICSVSITCLDYHPAPPPVSIILSAAGGIIPMAKESNIPESLVRTRKNVDFSSVTVCSTSLTQAIRFLQSLGDREGGCQEPLLQMGAICTALRVVTTPCERLLTRLKQLG
jgi:hypothetical protein